MHSPRQPAAPSAQLADDYALMDRLRARDAAAMELLYDRYAGAVYGLCRRALGDAGDSEDLLIDIFWELWDRADRYDPSRGSPVGYVLGLTRSRLTDRLRTRRSRARLMPGGSENALDRAPAGAAGPEQATDAAEQQARLARALAALPPDQRQALELAFYESKSHTEVAEQLHEPLGTIKSRIRQGLIRLRDALGGPDA